MYNIRDFEYIYSLIRITCAEQMSRHKMFGPSYQQEEAFIHDFAPGPKLEIWRFLCYDRCESRVIHSL